MRFLPREEKFYELFSEQARVIVESSRVLLDGARAGNSHLTAAAVKLVSLEQRGDELIHEIFTRLNQTFITPLDPEDIHSLSSHLDDILDGIEDAAHRIVAYKLEPIPDIVVELCQLVHDCTKAVQRAIEALSTNKLVLEHCIEVNRLEDEADRLVRLTVADLLDKETNAITVIKLKEVYEFLEDTMDACEDVADVLQSVVVKNS